MYGLSLPRYLPSPAPLLIIFFGRLDFSTVSLANFFLFLLFCRLTCCRGVSFLVQSHGIPEGVIDNVVKAAKMYFSLPEAAKMEVSWFRVPD